MARFSHGDALMDGKLWVKVMFRAAPIVVPAVILLAFGACQHNDGDNRGPAERAGAAVDTAGQKVGDTAASAATAVKQGVNDAATKVKEKTSSGGSGGSN